MLDLSDAAVTVGIAGVTAVTVIVGFWHRGKNGIAAAHSAHERIDKTLERMERLEARVEKAVAEQGEKTAGGLKEIQKALHNIEVKILEERASNNRRFAFRSEIENKLARLHIRADEIAAAVCQKKEK